MVFPQHGKAFYLYGKSLCPKLKCRNIFLKVVTRQSHLKSNLASVFASPRTRRGRRPPPQPFQSQSRFIELILFIFYKSQHERDQRKAPKICAYSALDRFLLLRQCCHGIRNIYVDVSTRKDIYSKLKIVFFLEITSKHCMPVS
jgi:hypothetical protein